MQSRRLAAAHLSAVATGLVRFLKSSYFSANPSKKQNVVVFVPFRHDTQALCDLLQSHNIDVGARSVSQA